MELIDALASLDVADDASWTADGLPRLDKLGQLTGKGVVTRDQVKAISPTVTRNNPFTKEAGPETPGTPGTPGTPPPAETTKEEGDLDARRKAAEEALTKANKVLAEAQQARKKAVEALDKVMIEIDKIETSSAGSVNVKSFQKSQQEERAKNAKGQAAIVAAIAAAAAPK